MSEVLSATNLKFLAQGMWTTLYLLFLHHCAVYLIWNYSRGHA